MLAVNIRLNFEFQLYNDETHLLVYAFKFVKSSYQIGKAIRTKYHENMYPNFTFYSCWNLTEDEMSGHDKYISESSLDFVKNL